MNCDLYNLVTFIKVMKNFILSFFLILSPFVLRAQFFLELHAESDHSFRAWEIVLENDSIVIYGNLELTWGLNNDFTEWQYRVDDKFGEIIQKFHNNPGLWELRSEGKVVSIRQVWPGDNGEWKISCGENAFTFRTIYSNQLDDWSIKETEYGKLILYTESQGDPRDWIVEDYMLESISFEERMAAVFIGIFSSIPKY